MLLIQLTTPSLTPSPSTYLQRQQHKLLSLSQARLSLMAPAAKKQATGRGGAAAARGGRGAADSLAAEKKRVNDLLVASGVPRSDLKNVSLCLRAGLLNGCFQGALAPVNEEEEEDDEKEDEGKKKKGKTAAKKRKSRDEEMKLDLTRVIWRGRCEGYECEQPGAAMKATIDDVLYQPDQGEFGHGGRAPNLQSVLRGVQSATNHHELIVISLRLRLRGGIPGRHRRVRPLRLQDLPDGPLRRGAAPGGGQVPQSLLLCVV
jgi:hypothetical protein